ncbi:MAG: DUF885 domain-containing protein, partial [Candidatus Methylomirabilis sp.]|nr:DUF885 domain-containing protein [Deltaproteobacteria bacterium]
LFATLLQHSQGLPGDAEELLARGEREVKRLEEELSRVAASLGSPDWRKLFERYKAIHPSADDLLAVYRRELASAKRFVRARELATIPPRDALQVVETPEFERASTPFAAYIPPPPFGRRGAAYFWVTPPGAEDSPEAREARLRGHPTLDIALTALHEGYPGHHLQFTWQSRLASPVRKIAHSAAMFEGWALYCEQMMWEEGFFEDPRQELMMLAAQLWRACRVVADVRLHTKGMKRDEAADLLAEVAGIERPQARAEANRYTMSPTNPLSYMAGKWMLQDLRAELERRMGATFNLGAFHDRVLSYGAIPIGLIVSDMLEEADRARAPAAGKAGLRVGRGRAAASVRGKRLSSRKPGRA